MLAQPPHFPLPELARSVASLKGVGPATAGALAERGYHTLGDLLFLFPLRYEDRRFLTPLDQLAPGGLRVVRGEVAASGRFGRGGKLWRMVLAEGEARLTLVWFRYSRPQMEAHAPGSRLLAVGEAVAAPGGGWQMIHPELHPAEAWEAGHPSLGRLLPVYPEVGGVRAGALRRVLAGLVESLASRIPDPLFGRLPAALHPLPAGEALRRAHLPPPDAAPDAAPDELDPATAPWRLALAADELFYYGLGLALVRARRRRLAARPLDPPGELLGRLLAGLPFRLTPGQEGALAAIRADLARPHPMGRLLAGDVGTGKTVVAAAAICLAAEAGVQSALLAPTEVLARQHEATLARLLGPLGIRPVLALGSQNGAARREAARAAAEGAPLLLGTHALLGEGLVFKNLGLCVIDEQHRFGVEQRLRLAAKGEEPHLLVLSATPIPRTLALALAGHLDLCELPERPAGRPAVATRLIPHPERRRAAEAMGQALARGERVYVICPLVEESEALAAQDATRTAQRLARYFSGERVGLLHGRLGGAEQQAALEAFQRGESRILVATTVVEVGVDVPEATLMVVLAAERFGLSQLHQLRGRVGRGERPGECLLVAGPQPGETARARLELLCRTTDGLELARADLELRGPGQALGARQAGLPPFRVARWPEDAGLAAALAEEAARWLAGDPELAAPGRREVLVECLRRWGRRLGLAEAG